MNRNTIIIVFIIGAIVVAASSLHIYSSKPSLVENRSAFNRPDIEKAIDDHAISIKRIELEGLHRRRAHELSEDGKFDEAIVECLKALSYTNENGKADQWVTRRALGHIYELAGKYDLALKELQWAESIQTRPDVLEQLAEDRKRLEAKIASQ